MRQTQKRLQFHIVFRPEPEGGFTVLVPALPGCISYGRDLREAKKMIFDAIRGYIASLRKHGEPIPSDEESFISLVQVPAKKSLVHV